jgi:putative effector of murein hydrolase LrgA (UPF0299 family)
MSRSKMPRQFAGTLFYAVVIGSAFRTTTIPLETADMTPDELRDAWWVFGAQLLLLCVVFEDWLSYFNYVQVESESAGPTSFKGLALEFTILLCWYLAFATANKSNGWFSVSFALFFVARWIGGISHYKELRSRLIDFLFLVPASVCLVAHFQLNWSTHSLWFASFAAWVVAITAWHLFQQEETNSQ